MSARNVCSGTRPSRYHSIRAISAPPRRPPQLTRMPCAPRRIDDCTDRFIARRNETRRRSEEHTSELQSLMRHSYDGFCLTKKNLLSQYILNATKHPIYETPLNHHS